jgi:hypothetical protein
MEHASRKAGIRFDFIPISLEVADSARSDAQCCARVGLGNRKRKHRQTVG